MPFQDCQGGRAVFLASLGPDDPGSPLASAFQHQIKPLPDDHMLARVRPASGCRQHFPA